MGLSANLRIRREEIKMTQKELAQKIGVEPATISKYESGMNEPNIKNLKSIAEALDTSIDELVKEEEDVVDLSKVNLLEILREQKRNKLEGNIYHYTQVKFAYNISLTDDKIKNVVYAKCEDKKIEIGNTGYNLPKIETNVKYIIKIKFMN